MNHFPENAPGADLFTELVRQLKRLPGVGEKGAARLALFLLKSPAELSESLSRAIQAARAETTLCPVCFNLSTANLPCAICRDERREAGILCVVETPADLQALEKSRSYRGRYHVLHGVLSPPDGIGPGELRINELILRLEQDQFSEILLALNPNLKGESTAHYLADRLRPRGVRITRIASGVPAGSELEYLDGTTLGEAIKYRRDWS